MSLHSKLFRTFWNILQLAQSQKIYSGDSRRSTSFVTSFRIILNLLKCFTTCAKSENICRRLKKIHMLCNFIQNHSNILECFTTCAKSENIFRRLRKVQNLCDLIQNYCEPYRMFYNLCKVKKCIQKTQESPQACKFI